MSQKKFQTSVRNLIVVVACFAAFVWAWRYAGEPGHPPTAEDWARSLENATTADKKIAAQKLTESSPDDIEVVVPALVRALQDKDPPVRAAATFALGQYIDSSAPRRPAGITNQASAAAKVLLVALRQDSDPVVRSSAAFTLSSIHSALLKAGVFSNESEESDPLKRGTLVTAFDTALKEDPSNRLPLIDALERLGPMPAEATPGLLEALKDPSVSVRGRVIATLAHFASGVDPVIPVLMNDVETNESQYPPDYFGAAKELHPTPAVVPSLIRSLESANWMVREAAALLLAQVGPPAHAAAPTLIAAAKKTLVTANDPNARDGSGGSQPKQRLSLAIAGRRPEKPPPGSLSAALATALVRIAPPEEAVAILVEATREQEFHHAQRGGDSAGGARPQGPRRHTPIGRSSQRVFRFHGAFGY